MAAKIGIFGETSDISPATVTLYTVDTDKAARVRIMWVIESGTSDSEIGATMGSPNDELLIHIGISANRDSYTGSARAATVEPAGSIQSSHHGLHDTALLIDISNGNDVNDWLVAPLREDYFISTGDTVKLIITGAAGVDGYANVQGVEDDA